jgi:integrase
MSRPRRGTYEPQPAELHVLDSPQRVETTGVRVEVVSKRLGHARIRVTYDMYTHPDDEQPREAADTFGRLLADGGGT